MKITRRVGMKKIALYGLIVCMAHLSYSGKTRIKNLTGKGPVSFFIEWPAIGCSNDIGFVEDGKIIDLGGHGSCEATRLFLDSSKMSKDESKNISNYSYSMPLPNSGGAQNVDIYIFVKDTATDNSLSRIDNPEGFMVEVDNTDGSPTFFNRLAGVAEQAADTSKKLLVDIGRLSGEIKGEDLVSVAKSVGTGGVSDIAAAAGGVGQVIASKVGPQEEEAPKEASPEENANQPTTTEQSSQEKSSTPAATQPILTPKEPEEQSPTASSEEPAPLS